MKITIAAIGHRLPGWAQEGVVEFTDRMPRDYRIDIHELKPEARLGQPVAKIQAAEASRLRACVAPGCLIVAMDERGKDWSTVQLADALASWRDQARDPVFLIGGADGLDPQLKKDADINLRLSSMTLPHALARVVLVEQLYRAWSILTSHPYHRA
jgi:23S rRNA (pseudouridine1915-N3)-methyltransferase